MEEESLSPSADDRSFTEQDLGQPGARAMEALAWAIAQEFVLVFDEFNDAVLTEDESGDPPMVRIAGK